MKHKNLMLIAAQSNISVLLQGESGSGKEVAARFIHEHSARHSGPFVALNCGAIAKNLAESILEGARRGAFTGATDQQGVVRAADGGTLFLDEIGELPLDIQCKLLRILQERTVLPLGQTQSIPVDFRLICATHRDLKAEVFTSRFREDLYFRLSVFPIRVPALRERDDIKELAQNLWEEILHDTYPIEYACGEYSHKKVAAPLNHLSPVDIQLITGKDWPGNVRQLKNVLQRYALLKPHGITLYEIISDEYSHINPYKDCLNLQDRSAKHYATAPSWDIIKSELNKNCWNKTATAKHLGVSRGCLNYQIRKNGGIRISAQQ